MSAGGIDLSAAQRHKLHARGKVLSGEMGSKPDPVNYLPMVPEIKEGDIVLFSMGAPNEDQRYYFCSEDHILAIVED